MAFNNVRHKLGRICVVGLVCLSILSPSFAYDLTEFQRHIDAMFPGYRIPHTSEFAKNIAVDSANPAVVTGRFTPGGKDFAAIIRRSEKQQSPLGKPGLEYVDIKLAICSMIEGGKYKCLEISDGPMPLPLEIRLKKTAPGSIVCYERYSLENRLVHQTTKDSLTVATTYGLTTVWVPKTNGQLSPCISILKGVPAHTGKYREIFERSDIGDSARQRRW